MIFSGMFCGVTALSGSANVVRRFLRVEIGEKSVKFAKNRSKNGDFYGEKVQKSVQEFCFIQGLGRKNHADFFRAKFFIYNNLFFHFIILY